MKRSRAPALPRAAGCPGERPCIDPCRAKSVALCGGVAARPQHAPGLRVVPGKHWGIECLGSRHSPELWPLPPARNSLGLVRFPDCTGALGFMPPTFSAFGG